MIPAFRRVRTSIDEVRQLQDAIELVVKGIVPREILDGRQIDGITFVGSPGAQVVNHGLGREHRGWFVVAKNASADIWDTQATNPAPSKTLALSASANVTISIWVY